MNERAANSASAVPNDGATETSVRPAAGHRIAAQLRNSLQARWRQGSEFMSWRQYSRIGRIYAALGMLAEAAVAFASLGAPSVAEKSVRSIFILRNNDIGDLLVTTPLFDALRRRFPQAHICVAVGEWNRPLLQNNPHISEVIGFNAPWYNHFVKSRSIPEAMRFIYHSHASRALAERRFDLGIDVLGSHFGSLLMIQARIPTRFGVKGFAGGHRGATNYHVFDPRQHVLQANLHVAELLGATDFPDPRPQLFLSDQEKEEAERFWSDCAPAGSRRVIVAPGGKPNKIWPLQNMVKLTAALARLGDLSIGIVGGPQDELAAADVQSAGASIINWAGKLKLRQTFALVAAADLIICNDSMLTHVAAAFHRPTLTLLGPIHPPAHEHVAIWGYPPPARMLGKVSDSCPITTPEEAFTVAQQMLNVAGRNLINQ